MSVVACSSSRSHPDVTGLSDRTRAVRRLASQRSLLPAAHTSSQLLTILHEAARLLPSSTTPAADAACGAGGDGTSATSAAYGDYIRKQCPTSRRVRSSFAAAGAHSPLGEMLQFFAVSLTHLFTDGVESAAALSFPTVWEQRLNAPEATQLREDFLYELQGFSALFTYVWGCVAASQSASAASRGEDPDEANEEEKDGVAVAVGGGFGASSSSTRPASPEAPVLKGRVSARRLHAAPPAAVVTDAPAPAAAGGGGSGSASLPRLGGRAGSLPNDGGLPTVPSSHVVVVSVTPATRRQHSVSLPQTAVARGDTAAQAKTRGHFLPSLPLEGLVPSSLLPTLQTGSSTAGTLRKGKSLSHSASQSATSPHSGEAQVTHLSRSARQQAIAAAIEHDRACAVQRTLGVRQVRNFAKEEDMQSYLHTFQANMHNMLDDEAGAGEEDLGVP